MFINTVKNNVNIFSVSYFSKRGFYLMFFNMLRLKCGLCERRLQIYRRVPPDEDYVGVDLKE